YRATRAATSGLTATPSLATTHPEYRQGHEPVRCPRCRETSSVHDVLSLHSAPWRTLGLTTALWRATGGPNDRRKSVPPVPSPRDGPAYEQSVLSFGTPLGGADPGHEGSSVSPHATAPQIPHRTGAAGPSRCHTQIVDDERGQQAAERARAALTRAQEI